MEPLKIRRSTLDGRINRIKAVIDPLVEEAVTLDQLNAELDGLHELWTDYRALDEEFLQNCTELKEIEDHLDFEADFRKKFNAAKAKVNQLIRTIMCTKVKPDDGSSEESTHLSPVRSTHLVTPELHLPKGILPMFNGDYGEWTSFFDLFTSAVHNNPRLTDAQRMLYLKQYTEGRAANMIRHMKVEDSAYAGALEVLKNKFDRKDQIVAHHIQRFIDIPSFTGASAGPLRKLHDTADDVRLALQALNRNDRDCWLVHLLLAKADPETRQLWVNKTAESTEPIALETFLEFIDIRVYALETAQSGTRHHPTSTKPASKPHQQRSHSYVATNEEPEAKCELCQEKRHFLYFCRRFKELTVEERRKHVQKCGLCPNCLRPPHTNGICNAGKCKKCNCNTHHTLLHQDTTTTRTNLSFGAVSNVSCSSFSSVFLATAVINVIDASGKPHQARALLDSASQASFITSRLSKKLGIQHQRVNLPVTGISGVSTRITSALNVTIQSRSAQYQQQLECAVLPTISGQLPSQRFDVSSWNISPDITLADANFNVPGEIDVLIGASAFFNLLENQQIKLGPSRPILQKTRLGWVVAGPLTDNRNPEPASCFVNTILDVKESEALRDLLAKFWEIEDLPSTKLLTAEEQQCEQHYTQHTTRDSTGRYIVKLPFKQDPSVIGVTGYAALHQFNTLSRRLQRDPEVGQLYHDYINGFLKAGHITKLSPPLPQDPIIYLPHHGVLKDSTTTKLRVVFNASMKSSNGVSLNDLLMIGPVVQKGLYELLLGFRLHNIAITGDIEKMYLQVKVTEEDRKLVRMLWQEPGEPMHEYTMNTVTFGMACAPYLATRTLNQLAEDEGHQFPEGKAAIGDFYVDDLLSGAATVEEAKAKLHQLTALLKRGGFSIRKWASNDPSVLADVPREDQAVDPTHRWDSQESLKTLGIQWQFRGDLFTFSVTCNPLQEHFTKAQVLSTTARIFDPLGFLGPVIVIGKLFMQDLWSLEIDWYEPLPTKLCHRWRVYLRHLQELWRIKIPRRVIGVDNPKRVLLHGYCDASANLYGAVVYLRAIDDNNNKSSRITCSKSRVAPIRRPSINKLELCSCDLLAELIVTVKAALSHKITIHEVKAFSDSKVALAWIAGDPAKWKPFVANRVIRINELLPSIHWGHISGKLNPADILSRGAAPAVLTLMENWWEGAEWDDEEQEGAPELTKAEQQSVEKEQRKFVPIHTYFSEVSESIEFILQKYSSYVRMVRVMAWVHRFVGNCELERVKRYTGPLQPVELDGALRMLIQYTQHQAYGAEIAALKAGKPLHSKSKLLPLCPFLESDLLRVGGRLARSNLPYDAKHPWILPYGSPLSVAIFRHAHLSNHHIGPQSLLATVRQKFWVPNGRHQARQIVWNCVPCYRANPNPQLLEQIMGQLPPERTQPAPPFHSCGVDYGGPITIVQRRGPGSGTSKGYIALFVCFATRAVHIEAVTKLSTKAFLAALSRFQSRRGVVGHMYSDRGTNFVGASREMRIWNQLVNSTEHNNEVADKLSQRGTHWHFNAPGTPHMGGLWEAAIKSAKTHLNKVTQNARLTFEEFATLLAEIEAILNSRPISPASSDPNDLQPLTPGHFLIGRPINATNQLHEWPSRDEPYDVRFKYVQELQQHFWDRWSREYVPELQQRGKWRKTTDAVQVGDLVLLKRSQSPMQMWQLGRIRKIHEAPDGHPRMVTVFTGNTEIVQSLHNLCKLPVNEQN